MKRMLVALVAALSAVAANAVEIGTLTWTGGAQSIAEDTHVTNLVVNGATTVTVAKDVTLTVDFLKGGKELTKKGNGAFVLKDFDPVYANSGLNIVKGAFRLGILGGGLAFPTVSATPFYRIDAMCFVNSSVHKTHLDVNGGVTYWQGTGDTGTTSFNAGSVKPQLTFAYLGGKPVVDFAAYTTEKANGAGLTWNKSVSSALRETFIVASDTEDVIEGDLDGQWYFGDSSGASSLYRGQKRRLARLAANEQFDSGFYNGLFEVDGKPATHDTVPGVGFHVIHQRSVSTTVKGAAKHWGYHEHGSDKGYGGIRIAEAVVFEQTLSDEDAAKITKYLQAKWLDGPSAKTLGTLKVSGDAVIDMRAGDVLTVGTLTVDGALKKIGAGSLHATVFNKSVGNVETAEGAFTYDSVAAAVGDAKTSFDVPADGTVQASRVTADGTFTKTGAGTLNAIVLAGGVNSIAVKGGTFKILADDGACPSDAYYHVDATNKAKLYVQSDGTCNYWEDRSGYSSSGGKTVNGTKPTFTTAYLGGRNCVDFASYYCANTMPDGKGSYFNWNCGTSDAKGIFVIFADSDDVRESDTIAGQNIVGCYDAGSFNRGADHALLDGSITSSGQLTALRNTGIFEIDGVATAYSTILPKGFHLVHMRLPEGSSTGLKAQSWGHSRYSGDINAAYYGGMMMSEGAIYTKDLTEAEVASATKYFLNKWFKQVKGGEYAFEKLTVANGATLDLDGRTVAATGLGGAGTVKAAGINLGANATLELDADADGVGKTMVTGALTLPAVCTVSFNGVPPKQGASYTILEAGSLTGDVTGWTIDTTNLPARRTASVKKVGNTVVLTISSPGLCIVVR